MRFPRISRSLRLAAPLLLVLPLAGCGWLNDKLWFGKGFEVQEVARANQCHAPGEKTTVQLLPDRAAVRALEQRLGFQLQDESPLDDGPFVLIQLGQRKYWGYSLAVSRVAYLADHMLRLTATFFEPIPPTPPHPNSICVLVAVPKHPYTGVELRDPSDAVIARSFVK
jgi:hypothetical protein